MPSQILVSIAIALGAPSPARAAPVPASWHRARAEVAGAFADLVRAAAFDRDLVRADWRPITRAILRAQAHSAGADAHALVDFVVRGGLAEAGDGPGPATARARLHHELLGREDRRPLEARQRRAILVAYAAMVGTAAASSIGLGLDGWAFWDSLVDIGRDVNWALVPPLLVLPMLAASATRVIGGLLENDLAALTAFDHACAVALGEVPAAPGALGTLGPRP